MRILADVHISPRTVEFLRSLGHNTLRVSDALTPTTADVDIVAEADRDRRIVLTQDLDFSVIVALSGRAAPSTKTTMIAQIPDRWLYTLANANWCEAREGNDE